MDETRLENALGALAEGIARVDSRLGTIEARLDGMLSDLVTKEEFAELVERVSSFGKRVESMLDAFEKRIPPQAA